MRTGQHREAGFTLTELMIVVAIGLIIAGMAMGGIPAMLRVSRADGSLAELAAAMRFARESAISNRRNVQVTFGTNTITITRVEYCSSPCTPTTTALRTVTLEGGARFNLVTGLPDTPDGFGNASATALGTYTPAMFTTDGSFINSQGDVLNGSLFIARYLGSAGQERNSARAVTIFGPTGAIRLWRWDGRAWVEV